MYESFYGLTTKPFSILPDPEFLYLSKKHRIALTMLEYAQMNNVGFCVITGEIGAGKTTLLRKLLTSLEDDITIGMITNTHQSFGELLDWVLSAYGIHEPGLSKVEMHQRFVDFLLEQYAKNKTVLLIVDEAQNMPATTLEELRMISNINSEKDLVLQIILAGQPDLKDTLRKPELKQFAQRISVDFHLDALNTAEACHYIQHRLVTAGATEDIFTPDACRLIAESSNGVPRLINLLCDTAMVYGFADQCKTIDANLIEQVISERMENSILPLVKPNKKKNTSSRDDDTFPWINPGGGTKGLKPAAEKKTIHKAVLATDQKNDGAVSGDARLRQAEDPTTTATGVALKRADNKVSKIKTPKVAAPADALIPERNRKRPTAANRQVANLFQTADAAQGKSGPDTPGPDSVAVFELLRRQNMLVPGSNLDPGFTDEYRRIKRPLLSNAFGKNASLIDRGNLILITSSMPGEGTTHTSINLALSIAQERDNSVLLVDCDVTRKGVSELLNLGEERGLVDVLEDKNLTVADVIRRTDIPRLSLLSAGKHHEHVTELLASQRMASLVDEMASRYADHVIIFDGPPVLRTPETPVLAGLVGQVVLVVEAGETPQAVVEEALTMIPEEKATGLVINKS
ncbi:MAG: XrtA-associated tyrosine autokinase [Gammaproteobacteria bacterium]